MSKSLDDWQDLLADHFSELSAQRQVLYQGHPVFVLEHGLDAGEVEELQEFVRAGFTQGRPVGRPYLPWVIYAAEVGYRFSGEEYWKTFENETPGWRYSDAQDLRLAFMRFRHDFGGATPRGAWASHFSYICWPITHAILPLDLQRSLAKLLYEIRFAITSDHLQSPSNLGELVKVRSFSSTSRFRQFAQDPQLVGQIAVALLLREMPQTQQGSILDTTLSRIARDLDKERRAREWLRSAQRTASARFTLKTSGTPPTAAPIEPTREERTEGTSLPLIPRLKLRAGGNADWTVILEVPELTTLGGRFPDLVESLETKRVVVTGASDPRPLARGRLLHGSQRIPLGEWPVASKAMLRFEDSDAELDFFVSTDSLVGPGPSWLFKIARDGTAYGLTTKQVHPGSSYITIRTHGEETPDPSWFQPVQIGCSGVNAFALDVPETVTAQFLGALQKFNLGLASGLQVWPAGVCLAAWDLEGSIEAIAGEHVFLGVRCQEEVPRLRIAVSDIDLFEVTLEAGTSTFLELTDLAIGKHTLNFSGDAAGGKDIAGSVELLVREPRSWHPEGTIQGSLDVWVDPQTPTLEQLWEGNAYVEAKGPRGWDFSIELQMFDRLDAPALAQFRQIAKLPLDANDWKQFWASVGATKDVQNAYDEASYCQIDFDAGDLGRVGILCEREFRPIRWKSVANRGGARLSLLHDESASDLLTVEYYDPVRPCEASQIETEPFLEREGRVCRGGLYVAKANEQKASIVFPREVRTLGDLQVRPETPRIHNASGVQRLIRTAEVWRESNVTGNVSSSLDKQKVLQALTDAISSYFCGPQWRSAESRFRQSGDLERFADELDAESLVRGLPDAIRRICRELSHDRRQIQAILVRSLAPYFVPNELRVLRNYSLRNRVGVARGPQWFAHFALRLASDPPAAALWATNELAPALAQLEGLPLTARAARFMVLAVNQESSIAQEAGSNVGDGWTWN